MTYTADVRLDHMGVQALMPHRHGVASWYSWILLMSLSVNVAVIAFLVFQMREGEMWFEVATKEPVAAPLPTTARSESLKSEISYLFAKSDEEVIAALENETVVANGYRLQELAVAVLLARGYQVEDPLRPLGAWPQPLSAFSWTDADGKHVVIKLFSHLGAREIQAVRAFICETAVPFTAEGIVRKMSQGHDSVLMKNALVRTDEWMTFSRLFSALPEEERLSLAKDVGGEPFSAVVAWGLSHTDPKDVGPFIASVFSRYPSPCLAELVASTYADVVVFQASDETALLLFSHLPPQSEAGVRLAMRLLHGQRKLPVWQASQAYLARAASMPTLCSMRREEVLAWLQQVARPVRESPPPTPQREAPAAVPAPKPAPMATPSTPVAQVSKRVAARQLQPYRTYVVRKGDTLWSIAKRFNVDVEKLKYLNGLKGTTLTPGKVLRIPH